MDTKRERVLMAMSGGVDSSVAALVLQGEGYDVTGVTMKLFDDAGANASDASAQSAAASVEGARPDDTPRALGASGVARFGRNAAAGHLGDVHAAASDASSQSAAASAREKRADGVSFTLDASGAAGFGAGAGASSASDGSLPGATSACAAACAPGGPSAPSAPLPREPFAQCEIPSLAAGNKACCTADDAEDARQVCLSLGIEHFVYNFTRTFEGDVVERFCDGYLRGETPNPCIDCNRYVKFAALQHRRADLGFDYVATGHYARREFNELTGRYELKRGLDANKDQTYVLFHLTQDALAHMLFPLGNLSKPQVRELAERHGFINARKAESQDICFVPDGDYASFIQRRRGVTFEPGPIVNRDGRVLGRHAGLVHYTIGQRKGIGVAAAEPLYVFAKDMQRNELIVDTAARAVCRGVEVRDVNFIARAGLQARERFLVKTHYRQKPRPALVEQIDDECVLVTFDEPQRACAPGQAAVVYDGDSVVCGGTIVLSL